MKIHFSFSLFLALIFIATSCNSETNNNAYQELSSNQMDFRHFKKYNYKSIYIKLPLQFKKHTKKKKYVLKKNALLLENNELHLNFSIEKFSKKDAEKFQLEFDEKLSEMDAIHDYYAGKRMNSLTNTYASIKKEFTFADKNKGVIQTIEGDNNNSGFTNTYHLATFKVKNYFYVIQFIGKNTNMSYLYDDFNFILHSIKIK
ncbi:MAG: hypothetical protein HYR91_02260 [Flavobacteriia bacterium]|nr:hypothetical protein [Flavobacteriia bacterium]